MSSRTGAKARAGLASSAGATVIRGGTGNIEKPKQRRKYAEIDVQAMMAGAAPADANSRDLGCAVEGTVPPDCRSELSAEFNPLSCIPASGERAAETAATSQAGECGEVSGTLSNQTSAPDSRPEEKAPTSHAQKSGSVDAEETDERQRLLHLATGDSSIKASSHTQASAVSDAAVSRQPLPRGWRQCEDDNGETYYWHVRSGAVQRERPVCAPGAAAADSPSEFVPDPNDWRDSSIPLITAPASRNQRGQSKSKSPSPRKEVLVRYDDEQDAKCSDYLNQCEGHLNNLTESCMRESAHNLMDDEVTRRREAFPVDPWSQDQQRFPAWSLGWLSLVDSDLADADSSSKAINRCITELTSSCRANDGAVWTEGKEIYLDIEGTELRLTDPANGATLCTQSVQSIRVWAISGQSPSDFAYVARDVGTRQLKCHVFRCEFAARRVTEALQAACGRAANERKRRSVGTPPSSTAASTLVSPDGLPPGKSVTSRTDPHSSTLPSPMEGPKKAIRCHYLGSVEVHRPTGIDILNGAIEKIMHRNSDPVLWQSAMVVVSPSVVSISDVQDESRVLAECRIRYLAFLGISSTDVKLCGFIVHTAEDEFVAHAFHCEPSAGALCKTIEAACKLRFQKCLDAQPDLDVSTMATHASAGKALQDTVKKGVQNILSKMWPSRKA